MDSQKNPKKIRHRKYEYVTDFFRNPDLVETFFVLYEYMRMREGLLTIRGKMNKKDEIIGVSFPGEKYLFYIVPDKSLENNFNIVFKEVEKCTFNAGNEEQYFLFANKVMDDRLANPDKYLIGNKQKIQTRLERKMPAKAGDGFKQNESPQMVWYLRSDYSDNEIDREKLIPLYICLEMDPSLYAGEKISRDVFSVRAYNCLSAAGIITVDQLLGVNEAGLLRIPQLGRTTIKEIKSVLLNLKKAYNDTSGGSELLRSDNSKHSDDLKYIQAKHEKKNLIARIRKAYRSKKEEVFSSEVTFDDCEIFYEELRKHEDEIFQRLQEHCEKQFDQRLFDIFRRRTINGETLETIGQSYDLSRERIRQLEIKGLRLVRKLVELSGDLEENKALEQIVLLIEGTEEGYLFVILKEIDRKHGKGLRFFLESVLLRNSERNWIDKTIKNAPKVKEKPVKKAKEKKAKISPPSPIPTGRSCPRCGTELVVRASIRGKNPGHRFIGCSRFPKCWYHEPLSSKEASRLNIDFIDREIEETVRMKEKDSSEKESESEV